jgi:hypothetical protein
MAGNSHEQNRQDQPLPDLSRPENRHERADVDAWAVYKFGIALAFLCILSMGLLFGLYRYFVNREGGPMAHDQINVDARRLPPMPRLQAAPITDLKDMRAAEEQILKGYGWVDQAHGVVRIPIDRAIDLLAQRGLPTRPQTDAQAMARDISEPTESGLGPKVHRPGGPLAGEMK